MNHVLSISLVAGNTIEEVIMRRAQRKLQLSDNVIGENVMFQEEKGLSGAEPGDLRSIIYGLHKFDLTEVSEEKLGEPNMSLLSAIADKVISKRSVLQEEDNGKLEISPMDLDGRKLEANTAVESLDVDESSYLSWVENFKEMSQRADDSALEPGNRKRSDEEKKHCIEAARKKAEDTKLSKWQSLGYQSLSIGDPILPQGDDMMSDSGAVQFVSGDCTRPSTTEPIIIFSCGDDSGNWGRGGMFDALAKLSTRVPEAYERASEFGDLHLGDLHLIELNDDADKDGSPPKWVALAIVQSYSPKRKVPRSAISIPDLESCIAKASFSAAQKSASIHMPRVGYQDGSDRAVWYSTERILRKHASIYGIKIFVYYYKRSLAQG